MTFDELVSRNPTDSPNGFQLGAWFQNAPDDWMRVNVGLRNSVANIEFDNIVRDWS